MRNTRRLVQVTLLAAVVLAASSWWSRAQQSGGDAAESRASGSQKGAVRRYETSFVKSEIKNRPSVWLEDRDVER